MCREEGAQSGGDLRAENGPATWMEEGGHELEQCCLNLPIYSSHPSAVDVDSPQDALPLDMSVYK